MLLSQRSPLHKLKNVITSRPKSSKTTEDPKIVISESKRQLAKHCLIHVIPILTTVLILFLNWHGHYIGQDFAGLVKSETVNLALLQLAAKIHELLIGSSLTLIVLQVVRHELLFGDGLPLGLVGSGLVSNSFESLLKKEFRAAALHSISHQPTAKKCGFVLLVVVSSLIAVLAGPSSAVLLVPKSQSWPSGASDFYLSGVADDFWPVDLATDLSDLLKYCNQNNSASLAVCPAGGFLSLWEHWGRTNFSSLSPSMRVRMQSSSLDQSFTGQSIVQLLRYPRYALGGARYDNDPRSATWLAIPHAAPATIQQQLTTDWWNAMALVRGLRRTEIDDRQAYSTNYNAIASVRCTEPQNLSSTATVVRFPSLQGRFDFAKPLDLDVTNLSSTPSDHLRFRWVHLPDDFGALSIGGIFESAWANNGSRVVIGCSIQSGWVPAQTSTDEYTFWTGWYPWNITFGARIPFFNAVPDGQPIGKTNGRIALGDTWLNLLTPTSQIKSFTSRLNNPSTIESIFESAGLDDSALISASNATTMTDIWTEMSATNGTRARLVEAIICSVIVDGLSRYGSYRVFQNASDPSQLSLTQYERLSDFNQKIVKGQSALVKPPAEQPTTTLHMQMLITGFSFRLTLAGELAASVLIAHLVMAVAHIAWILYKRQTSKCWTLISELVALAYNSRTSQPGIRNASAAIHETSTFCRMAKIRVRAHAENSVLDRVELLFDDSTVQSDGEPLVERPEFGEVSMYDRNLGSVSESSFRHAHTWSGSSDSLAYSTSNAALAAKATDNFEGLHTRVVVGRAYG